MGVLFIAQREMVHALHLPRYVPVQMWQGRAWKHCGTDNYSWERREWPAFSLWAGAGWGAGAELGGVSGGREWWSGRGTVSSTQSLPN